MNLASQRLPPAQLELTCSVRAEQQQQRHSCDCVCREHDEDWLVAQKESSEAIFYENPKVAAKSETPVNADFNNAASEEVKGLLAGGSNLRTKAVEAYVHFRGLLSGSQTPRGFIKPKHCCCRGAMVLIKQTERSGSCFLNGLDGSGAFLSLMVVFSRKVVRGAELQPAHPGPLFTAWEF